MTGPEVMQSLQRRIFLLTERQVVARSRSDVNRRDRPISAFQCIVRVRQLLKVHRSLASPARVQTSLLPAVIAQVRPHPRV